MAPRVNVWAVGPDGSRRVERSRVRLEIDLERWIEENPSLLSEGLTVVGRQVRVDGGFIDLLCTDVRGRWIVVELKRERLYRDAVAQALDYAHSILAMSDEELRSSLLATAGVEGEAPDALLEASGSEEDRDVAIIVAGSGIDPGLERIASFLSRYGVPLRVVSFDVFQLNDDEQLLVRDVIDDEHEALTPRRRVTSPRTTEEISLLGQDPELRAAFDRIVEAAESAGLYVRPYTRGVMIAPSHMRNRYLMYLRPIAGRGMKISHGPEAFAEFFPELTVTDVEQRLGSRQDGIYAGQELGAHVAKLERFLGQLPRGGAAS